MSGFLLGIVAKVHVEESEQTVSALVAVASNFLRAGGVLTPGDWAQLDSIERDALTKAGDEIAEERSDYLAQEIARNFGVGEGSMEGLVSGAVERLADSVSVAGAQP